MTAKDTTSGADARVYSPRELEQWRDAMSWKTCRRTGKKCWAPDCFHFCRRKGSQP